MRYPLLHLWISHLFQLNQWACWTFGIHHRYQSFLSACQGLWIQWGSISFDVVEVMAQEILYKENGWRAHYKNFPWLETRLFSSPTNDHYHAGSWPAPSSKSLTWHEREADCSCQVCHRCRSKVLKKGWCLSWLPPTTIHKLLLTSMCKNAEVIAGIKRHASHAKANHQSIQNIVFTSNFSFGLRTNRFA